MPKRKSVVEVAPAIVVEEGVEPLVGIDEDEATPVKKKPRVSKPKSEKAEETAAVGVKAATPKKRAARKSAVPKIVNEESVADPVAMDGVLADGEPGMDNASPAKKARRVTKAKAKAEEVDADAPMDTTPSPAKKSRKKKVPVSNGIDDENASTPARRSTRPRKAVAPTVDEGQQDEDVETETPKKRRRTKTKEPVVYVIPDVERKETTFKGRLGYACLNTVLRVNKPEPIFCSRTCRLDTIAQKGIEFAKDLGLRNAQDLYKMIEWNAANKIFFMRISSEMFPFASHAQHGYSLSYAEPELARAGELARGLGMRLTMHPGQFTQLGSPKEGVVEASVRELDYQCEILDRMGMGADSVMIIHMGGVYNDKPSTIERFKQNYRTKLTEGVKRRLVLENDELCYNVDDILPVSEELGIPVVLDYHHDWIYPSSRPVSELIPLINAVWARKGIKPKQHLSEPRPGAVTPIEKRAHADRCKSLPPDLPDDMDLMIEAKDKEQAVFELWRIYGLHEPIWENLRPPAEVQELATKGRKSRVKKKKMGAEGDGEEVLLTEPDKEGDERALVDGSPTKKGRKSQKSVVEDEGEESELTELEDDEETVLV